MKTEPADTLNQIILWGVSQPLELELPVGGGKVWKIAATQSRPPTPSKRTWRKSECLQQPTTLQGCMASPLLWACLCESGFGLMKRWFYLQTDLFNFKSGRVCSTRTRHKANSPLFASRINNLNLWYIFFFISHFLNLYINNKVCEVENICGYFEKMRLNWHHRNEQTKCIK